MDALTFAAQLVVAILISGAILIGLFTVEAWFSDWLEQRRQRRERELDRKSEALRATIMRIAESIAEEKVAALIASGQLQDASRRQRQRE